MAKAILLLADGCEEMEAVITVDTLRRAKWEVVTVGLHAKTVTASRGVVLVADRTWQETEPSAYDILLVPGGAAGTQQLQAEPEVIQAVQEFAQQGKLVGAICAGPLVLQSAGLLQGRRATCHPALRDEFEGEPVNERVVIDGNIVTSQGPGTAFEFALTLIGMVDGADAVNAVAPGLILAPGTLLWEASRGTPTRGSATWPR